MARLIGPRRFLESGKIFNLLISKKTAARARLYKEGFLRASGDYSMIQDADLEYNPKDFVALFKPIIEKKADVVFGTRFRGEYQRVQHYFFSYQSL